MTLVAVQFRENRVMFSDAEAADALKGYDPVLNLVVVLNNGIWESDYKAPVNDEEPRRN